MNEHAAHLRVFFGETDESPRPAAGDADVTADDTLTDFFYRYVWPLCLAPKGDRDRTLKDYKTTLAYWRRFTGDPPLRKIDKRTLSKFIRLVPTIPGQKDGEKLAANTVRKHCDTVQRLLNYAGPESRQNLDGANLLDKPPWVRPPRRHQVVREKAFTLEELYLWLEACRDAMATEMILTDVEASVWWRAIVLFDYNTGVRLDTLMRLRWEMIDGDWLKIPPDVIKRNQGQMLWLNGPAKAAIETLPHRSGLIFNWRGWPDTHNTLQAQRRRLQRAAGVPIRGFQALRESLSTQLARINPIAAQIMMNHKGLGMAMMIDHYLDAEAILSDALAKMPQPRLAIQKRLFD